MARTPPAETSVDGRGLRLALVTSEYNSEVTNRMRERALEEARRLGARVTVDVRAPGVYDLCLIAHAALARSDVDGLVALGAVIAGETRHDELVAREAARALTDLSLRHEKPVGLGITGPGQTLAQARARIDRAGFAVRSVCKQYRTIEALARRDAGAPRAQDARVR